MSEKMVTPRRPIGIFINDAKDCDIQDLHAKNGDIILNKLNSCNVSEVSVKNTEPEPAKDGPVKETLLGVVGGVVVNGISKLLGL